MIQLSVIIPCYNCAEYIGTQLEAFAHQEYSQPWEIIIADNGSTDNTLEIVRQYQQKMPHLRIVDASGGKKCAAYPRNIGAQVAKGEALAFCDADDEVFPGWVAAMGEALSKYDFVAGKSDYTKLNLPWVVAACAYREGNGVNDNLYYPFAGGNNIGIKRHLFYRVGGFDEDIRIIDDVDFCWRVQAQCGVKLIEVPGAKINFRFRDTIKEMYQRWYGIAENNILLLRRHGLKYAWKNLFRDFVMLVARLLIKVRSRVSFARWMMDLGWFLGTVHGMWKYRHVRSQVMARKKLPHQLVASHVMTDR
ncbi:glycosyltransferase [Calothrix sp. NIES-3974]|uniref:glycosyltransferase n=1 Tax=Calothrix sp. NIES-3974 TaxID=2005462 RepID=UPI000B61209C|nr:glycosyltransferase [Calothrix sp. NIES-3974]BAZ06465.1 putative glycosyl transferase [Calothrix sp. NIES-3974]